MLTPTANEPALANSASTVFIVDDDPRWCSELRASLEPVGLRVSVHDSPEDFLDGFDDSKRGCVLLAARVPGGLELQERLKALHATIPVIVITFQDEPGVAIRAMKLGAFDVFPQPPSEGTLLETVSKALELHGARQRKRGDQNVVRRRIEQLTVRQMDILSLIVAGRCTKEIAVDLGLSHKTIENHRTSIMRRMGVDGVVDLVRTVCLSSPTLEWDPYAWKRDTD